MDKESSFPYDTGTSRYLQAKSKRIIQSEHHIINTENNDRNENNKMSVQLNSTRFENKF